MTNFLKAAMFVVGALLWILGVGIFTFVFAMGFDRIMEPVISAGIPEAEVISAGIVLALLMIAALTALIIKR